MSAPILHVTDAFPPERGGVERVVEELAAAQVRAGRRVQVLTKAVAGAPAREVRADGVEVFRYPFAARPTPWKYLTSIRASRRLARQIDRESPPALVHFHLTLSAQGPLDLWRGRKPLVYSFYGPWHAEFAVEAEEIRRAAGGLYRAYLDEQMAWQRRRQIRLLRAVDRVAVLSEFSRGWIGQLAPERAADAVRIPGGIDPDRFTPDAVPATDWRSGADFVVLTVRRLARRMGLDLLLAAVAELKTRGLAVRCLIAGGGPLRRELEEQAERLGITAQVCFLGFVPDEQLPGLYRAADLFVVPSRAEENFGLIVLEAAACGVPVAATPVGSLPEMLAAVASPYQARETTAAALTEVIERAARERESQARACREIVSPRLRREFSWQRIAVEFDRVYAGLGVD